MKLSEYISNERGRGVAIASAIGVPPQLIYQWASGRPVPVPRCVPIEAATNGMVTRKDLRPNDWMDLWPELSDNQRLLVERRRAPNRRAKDKKSP